MENLLYHNSDLESVYSSVLLPAVANIWCFGGGGGEACIHACTYLEYSARVKFCP